MISILRFEENLIKVRTRRASVFWDKGLDVAFQKRQRKIMEMTSENVSPRAAERLRKRPGAANGLESKVSD